MAIRIIYPDDGDRERRSAFTNRLIPESPYRSAGVPIPECRKIAKGLGSDDIELVYIEDVIIKGIVIFSSHEPFEKKGLSKKSKPTFEAAPFLCIPTTVVITL